VTGVLTTLRPVLFNMGMGALALVAYAVAGLVVLAVARTDHPDDTVTVRRVLLVMLAWPAVLADLVWPAVDPDEDA
jgi:uncharacterized membrane protein YeiB